MWRTAKVTTIQLNSSPAGICGPSKAILGMLALAAALLFGPSASAQQNGDAYSSRDAYGGLPEHLTIPAGTTIVGRLNQYLSSHQNRAGDGFTMTLDQPVVVNGWVVARPGQLVSGEVTVANKGGAGKGSSQLGIELTELTLVDGQQVPVYSQLVQYSGPSNTGRNVAAVGATTGLGAAIGAAADGGRGAGAGAIAGAAAGLIGVLLASGRPADIPPESLLTFRLTAPVDFSTRGSERAFLPVSPQDYGATGARYAGPPRPAPRPVVRAYPPYPWPYPYPYVYVYPRPYVIGPSITIVRRPAVIVRPGRGWGWGRR